METQESLHKQILLLTDLIKEKYPELQASIGQMPDTLANDSNPQLTIKLLQEYYNSLVSLVKKYEEGHSPKS